MSLLDKHTVDYYYENDYSENGTMLAEAQCMAMYQNTSSLQGLYCEPAWDGFLCWGNTPANTTASQPCPKLDISYFSNETLAYKTCNAFGMWEYEGWTNYTLCLIDVMMPPHHDEPPTIDYLDDANAVLKAIIVIHIYFFGSIVSLLLLGLTLFIFTYFKALQCSRITIHKNLVASFILRSLILIIYSEPYVLGRQRWYRDIDWLCKLLICVHLYSQLANILWMFVEGLFLHNRIAVTVFHTDAPFRVFYLLGWVLPILIIFPWAMCMHFHNINRCWDEYDTLQYNWIVVVPSILALSLNAVFLVNIIRILITRLRANNTLETDQVRKAVKATAVLFPLLGLTNMLFFIAPSGGSKGSETAYLFSNAILQSSQGIFVSVIYCFMNAEVRLAIRKKWLRYQNIRMGRSHNRRQSYRTSSMFLSTSEGTDYSLKRKGSKHTSPHLFNNIANGHSSRPSTSSKKPKVIMSSSIL